MVLKLKYEHVSVTSFSKMQVDLAAQVQNMKLLLMYMYTAQTLIEYV